MENIILLCLVNTMPDREQISTNNLKKSQVPYQSLTSRPSVKYNNNRKSKVTTVHQPRKSN